MRGLLSILPKQIGLFHDGASCDLVTPRLSMAADATAPAAWRSTVIRRASSRVSRFGRRAVRRSDMSGIAGEAEVRGLRLKRR